MRTLTQATLPLVVASCLLSSGSFAEDFDPRDSESSTGRTWKYSEFADSIGADIDPASLGDIGLGEDYWVEDVDDNGKRVKNTKVFPARAIVWIESEKAFGGGSTRCSGFMIGHRTVATAAHCIYRHLDNGKSGWNDDVYVYPGKNGRGNKKKHNPYGRCGYKELNAPKGWTRSEKSEYDYGLIILDCDIGKTVGRLGYQYGGKILDLDVSLNTYASSNNRQQWKYKTEIEKVKPKRLYYQYAGSGSGGSSGSAVYFKDTGNCGVCAVGVHTTSGGSGLEKGVHINDSVFKNFRQWKKDAGDNG